MEPCIYCGLTANTEDHIPPQSERDKIIALGMALQIRFQVVPACTECNCLLGARSLWTVTERRAYIKKRLRTRYRSLLNTPNWTPDELLTLSTRLREKVISDLARRNITRQRITY